MTCLNSPQQLVPSCKSVLSFETKFLFHSVLTAGLYGELAWIILVALELKGPAKKVVGRHRGNALERIYCTSYATFAVNGFIELTLAGLATWPG